MGRRNITQPGRGSWGGRQQHGGKDAMALKKQQDGGMGVAWKERWSPGKGEKEKLFPEGFVSSRNPMR